MRYQVLKEALCLLKNRPIHVILVDYRMPHTDGVTVVEKIRAEGFSIPIIALTVEENEEVFRRFSEAGANDYSIKPIKPLDLIARIQSHLHYYDCYKYYNQSEKGISDNTLNTIVDCLRANGGYMGVEELREATGANSKTIYRYLQHLYGNKLVEQKVQYGQKGRPRVYYKLK